MATEYIDKEEACRIIRSYKCGQTAFDDGLDFAISEIAVMPAADVRPVNNRYIDGNELFRRIAGHSYYKGDDILTRISLMQEGKSKNEDVKPADVRPVVHRSWIVDDHGDYQLIECAQCHAQMWNHQSELPNYCYCCGADMHKVVEIEQVKEDE